MTRLTRLAASAERRVGFRGSRLILFGTIWILMGASVMVTPTVPRPWLVHEQLPTPVRAIGWVLTGSIAIWVGLRRIQPDGNAWAALTLMPTIRCASWTLAVAGWLITAPLHAIWPAVPVYGDPHGVTGALIYGLIVLLVSMSAGHHCATTVTLPPPPPLAPESGT